MKLLLKTILLFFFISLRSNALAIDTKELYNSSDSVLIAEGKLSLLAGLIYERLALAEEVAKWKFVNEEPIEDKQQETEVINLIVHGAIQMNLDTNFIKTFFQNQIDASKLLQNYYINSVFRDSAVSEATDLEYVIRPSINHVSNQMLLVFKDTIKFLENKEWREFFKEDVRQRIDTLPVYNARYKIMLSNLVLNVFND